MNKIAVVVLGYKNRYHNKEYHLVNNLHNFDKKYDVYLALQKNDPCLNEYYNLVKEDDHVKILVFDVTSASTKRDAIYNYLLEHEYDGYFQYDDDVNFVAYKIDESTKRETSNTYRSYKCDMNEMLDKIISVAQEKDAAYVSVTRWGFLGWQKPNTVKMNMGINPAQFAYFDINKMHACGAKYHLKEEVYEDIDMLLQLMQAGYNACQVCDYMYKTCNTADKSGKSSVAFTGSDKIELIEIGTYMKYHGDLKLDREGNFIRCKINVKQYFNTHELPPIKDTELYELCKTQDLPKIREYLRNKKLNSK